MKTSFLRVLIAAALTALLPMLTAAQTSDGWRDDLVDHLSGAWKLEGPVMGHEAHHEVEAKWTLNHRFLQIHEKTSAAAPRSEHRYEALWFLGYDPVSERYVLHLLDVFGARFSETLGYGVRDGNEIRFVFEYPDDPSIRLIAGPQRMTAGNGCWSKKTKMASGRSLPISNSRARGTEGRFAARLRRQGGSTRSQIARKTS